MKVTIKTKLLISILLVSLIPFITVSIFSYNSSKSEIENIVTKELVAIRENKSTQIEDYFKQIQNQITTYSNNKMIQSAMSEFKIAFSNVKNESTIDLDVSKNNVLNYLNNEFVPALNQNLTTPVSGNKFLSKNPNTILLQDQYISSNSNPLGSKHLLNRGASDISYNDIHQNYHPNIRSYLETFGYYDIFLVDADTGNIVYSVFKEADYATSLLDGPHKNSNIAAVFKSALNISKNEFVIEDFDFYNPSYNAPASFIASPIYKDGIREGVLIFQMPINKINEVMTNNYSWKNSGLGESGEVYLVGNDKTLRSNSRFLIEDFDNYLKTLSDSGVSDSILKNIENNNTSVLLQSADTLSTQNALSGKTGTELIKDYRNIAVLSSYSPLSIAGLDYIILSEIDESEAFDSIYMLRNFMLFIALISIVSILFIGFLLAVSLSRPLLKTALLLQDISEGEGDLTKSLNSNRSDEIGLVAKWFNLFVSKLKHIIRDLLVSARELNENVHHFDTLMTQSNENLDDIINSVNIVNESIQNNASISEEINASIEELSSSANAIYQQTLNTMDNSKSVSNAVTSGQTNITDVVQAIDNVKISSDDVSNVLKELQQSADQIGNIVNLIQSISEQTNLLALNASIEAARAGEAGKGFAVVAEEVRKLAEESNSSTETIRTTITTIQDRMLHTIQIVDNEKTLVDQSVEKSEIAKNEFDNIANSIQTIIKEISEITKATHQQSTIADDMALAIESLATSTQDNALAVQDITAKTNLQSSIIKEIQHGNESIKKLTRDLDSIANKFIIN